MSGWFAVKRGILEHGVFAPKGKFSRLEAWIWIIENTAYKLTTINLNGTPHDVPRGSLCFSLRFMAEKWGWSVKAVRTFIATLEAHQAVKISQVQVGKKKGTARTQLTICNYDKYQPSGHSSDTAGAQQGHKDKQRNNIPVGSGDKTPPKDAKKIAFDSGIHLLGEAGVTEKHARSLIGRWIKNNGEANVISALGKCQRAGAIDPVPYLEAIFKQSGNTTQKGYTDAGAFGKIPELC